MRGYGGVLSFELRGGFEAVKRVLPKLQLATGPPTSVRGDGRRPPATTSHVECTPQERAAMGIPEG